MAKFTVDFDTEAGCTVDMDGKKIENVTAIHMYRYNDAEAECSIETQEKVSEGVWKTVRYMSRSMAKAELKDGRATASEYGDLVRVEGHTSYAEELCKLLKRG